MLNLRLMITGPHQFHSVDLISAIELVDELSMRTILTFNTSDIQAMW